MSQLKNMIRGAQPEVIVLESGTYILGRDPECDYQLAHPSVSTLHCEIRRERGRVFVRDLGSTNGTYIDDQPVKEAELLPDQVIRFGELPWRFQGTGLQVGNTKKPTETAEAPPPFIPTISIAIDRATKAAEVARANESPPVQRPCGKHARKPAIYLCVNCRSEFCPECLRTRKTSKGERHNCPICNGRCEDIGAFELKEAAQKVDRERRRNLFLSLPEVFMYPLRGWSLVSMMSATLLFGFLAAILHVIPALGALSLFTIIKPVIASICITAYLVAYMYKIVQASANGEPEMPEWMDLSNWWDDICMPALHFFGTVLFSFSPVIIFLICTFPNSSPWVWIPLLILGLSYFPMAYLAVCMSGTLIAVNPVTVYWSILRVPMNYYLACLIFWGAYFLSFTIDVIASLMPLKYDMLGLALKVISIPFSLYLFVIEARVLGLIYYGNSDKLGWFDEKK